MKAEISLLFSQEPASCPCQHHMNPVSFSLS